MVAFSRNASLTLQPQIKKTANYTVVIVTDIGKVFSSVLDNMVYTLPSIAEGDNYTFINVAEDGDAKVSISPNASDGIVFAGVDVALVRDFPEVGVIPKDSIKRSGSEVSSAEAFALFRDCHLAANVSALEFSR